MSGKSAGEKELQAINAKLEELMQMVLQQFLALKQGADSADWPTLQHLIGRDVNVDAIEQSIDDLSIMFVANRAPLGGSLRFLFGTIDVASGLERIGDCIEYVARHLLELGDLRREFPEGWRLIQEAINKSLQVYERAIQSLSHRDTSIAKIVRKMDDGVDALQDQTYQMVIEQVRARSLDIELGLHLVLIINKLESIADIACHISDTVVYIVDDERVRHVKSRQV